MAASSRFIVHKPNLVTSPRINFGSSAVHVPDLNPSLQFSTALAESITPTLAMPPSGMAPPVADGESSPAPATNEGETSAEAVEVGVGVAVQECVMEVGAVAAVEKPDEVEPKEAVGTEPKEGVEAAEPEEAAAMEAEYDDEDADEDPDEEEDKENVGEEVDEACDEEAVMEPLAVLRPEEVDDLEESKGEEESEEPSEVDEESKEVGGEEPKDAAQGFVHRSAADSK